MMPIYLLKLTGTCGAHAECVSSMLTGIPDWCLAKSQVEKLEVPLIVEVIGTIL